MHAPQTRYQSYLIRCWWADNGGQPVWRITVQAPGSETQRHFANLAALCAWLAEQLNGHEGDQGTDKESRLCN